MRQMSDAAWKRHLAKKGKELDAANMKYLCSDEASKLPSMTTVDLIAMHRNDHDWLRHPCGMSDIDGSILARSRAVSKILVARGVPFYDGAFHVSPQKEKP